MNNYILLAEEGDIIGEKKLIAEWLCGTMDSKPDKEGRNVWIMEDGSRWSIVVMGVGALNVIRVLRDMPRDARLINIGYAGSANYNVGSAVCVTESRLNHPCVHYPEPNMHLQILPECYLRRPKDMISSICYSGADFVLASDYTDCVFDMELAYIAAFGFEHLSAIKIVSDNLSLHTYHEVAAGVE